MLNEEVVRTYILPEIISKVEFSRGFQLSLEVLFLTAHTFLDFASNMSVMFIQTHISRTYSTLVGETLIF